MYELEGKTALITGAARRIGRGVARGLAEAGMNIVIHYNTSRAAAEEAREQILAVGVRAWVVQADLAARPEAEQLVEKAAGLAGSIDVLVNGAAIFPESKITNLSGDELDSNIRINALSPLLLSRGFAAQTRNGAIVNFLDSRVAGHDLKHAAYGLSKKMLLEMTELLALELAPDIRVNAVAPGLILPPPGEDEAYLEKKKHTVPLAAHGDLQHIVEAVRFLVINDFVTGQVIYVDGGRHLKGGVYE